MMGTWWCFSDFEIHCHVRPRHLHVEVHVRDLQRLQVVEPQRQPDRACDFLRDDALPAAGCPFAGSRWQLWVNLTLAHAEVRARGGGRAWFAGCAPERNRKLLGGGELERFRQLLRDPDSVVFVDLEQLLVCLTEVADAAAPEWVAALRHRYAGI